MPKHTFVRGAMILGGAGAATKVMGMMVQIAVARELGAQGFGLFQSINPIFYLLLTISTLALPPALSKVIAENLALGNLAKAQKALRISHITVIVLSVSVCAASITFAPHITANWLDPKAELPFFAILLRIPIVCLSSVLSGYYMGIQNQTPPAISWIMETMARTAVTIPLIFILRPYGIAYGAVAVVVGAGIGDFVGYLYMLWRFLAQDRHVIRDKSVIHPHVQQTTQGTLRDLVQIAIPNSITNLCSIIFYAAEPIIIYLALANVGIPKAHATVLFGKLGMAIELLLLPTVISSAISSVVIPAISEAAAMRNTALMSRRLYQVIQTTLFIGLPAMVFFILSGHDFAFSLYKDPLAGALLAYIAPVCIYIYVLDPLSAILQGLNKAGISTVISLASSVLRIACIYYFVVQAKDGIYGVATAFAISGIFTALISVYFVRKFIPLTMDFGGLLKIIIASGIASIPIHQIQTSFSTAPPVLQALFSGLIGFVVYFFALLYLDFFRTQTLASIPWVGPICLKMRLRTGGHR